jgi:trehalose 6-phosphate phosphatase
MPRPVGIWTAASELQHAHSVHGRAAAARGLGKITGPTDTLPPPPFDLLRNATLFLDLDGTLLSLVDRPDEVRADAELVALLERLTTFLDNRLAVVSGRSISQLDDILGNTASAIALSGSHGSEHRWQNIHARPERPRELDLAAERMRAFAAASEGVLVEEKSFGVALHYRMAPQSHAGAQALVRSLADEFRLVVQDGKMMTELRVPGGDKGKAITSMMRSTPMARTRPVFAGDDITDESGFKAVRELGGSGILVGPERLTAAKYRVQSPEALRSWLASASQ